MQSRTLAAITAFTLFAASNVAVQAQQSSPRPAGAKEAASTTAQPTQAVEKLQQASLRLRDAIRSLAQQQPGPNRDHALKAAREALADTQQAMARLPAEWKAPGGAAAQSASAGTGSTGSRPTPAEAMKRLQAATDSLYDAIHAMARQPVGESRNAAIKKANEALFEAEQAATLSELEYRRPAT